ncbi:MULTISPECIES: GntR family transcriptional regulator [Bacillales]|uniref:GntR family transcriptional regulator n=1 Tax=Lysinibacillus louembei TaxID=1470088 RepID=A0ABZ0S183_9BACI|nr:MULTISPECIES: GntR family transcriptional regulator [Bacillales]MCT6923786.1 GntR family transcriptional regulator [Metasolibacillus sp.]MCT6939981.1 GntR family transcriptional regulator [Metasolibacillus sp.]WPK13409.1 GntR family transcriptional regulator [Lysinibacillus louembei]
MDQEELRVKDYLLQGIFNGSFALDNKMPSELALVEQFKVPRIKIRNVYQFIEKMGYIYSRQGVGRFLKHQRKTLDVVMTGDVSFSDKMRKQTANYKSVVTKLERVPTDHEIYHRPQIMSAYTIYLVERLRYLDNEPAALHRSYVIAEHFPQIKQADNRLTSMYNFYKSNGINAFHSTFSNLSVSFPNELERALLSCEVLVPLVKVESDNWDKERNQLLEYTEIIYRTDRFSFQL